MTRSLPFVAAVAALVLLSPTSAGVALEIRIDEERTSCSESYSFERDSGEDDSRAWTNIDSTYGQTCESTDSDAGLTFTAGEETASADLGSKEASREAGNDQYEYNASRRDCGWPRPPCPYTYRSEGTYESRAQTTQGAHAESGITGPVTVATSKCESYDNRQTSSDQSRDEDGRVTTGNEGSQEVGSSCSSGIIVESPARAAITKDRCGSHGQSAFESRDAWSSTSRHTTHACYEGVMGSAGLDGTGTAADGTAANVAAGRHTWTRESCEGSSSGGEACTNASGDDLVLMVALAAGGMPIGGGSNGVATPGPLADFLDDRYDHLP
ncbi:MAG TPA: hypothetical protein VM889_12635 [Candidatus Thermoplasmatota archaeon]|nr:hypothetical protein [Candidatus Thermoplasmatota archaeon]